MRQRVTRKILSFLLCLAMVFTLTEWPAMEVKAGEASAITLTLSDGTQESITEDASGTGYSYVAETNTLTLSSWSGKQIYANGDLNLKLEGTNTITMEDDSSTAYGIKMDNHQLHISGSSASDKLVINGDLSSTAKAISARVYAGDYANVDITLVSTKLQLHYGIYGELNLVGNNANINVYVKSAYTACGIYALNARSDKQCGTGNVITAKAESTGSYLAYAISDMYVYGTNPKITAIGVNDGTVAGTQYAVYGLSELNFTEGGKLDAQGLVDYFYGNRGPTKLWGNNTVTTTPADNKYIFCYRPYINSRRNVICNVDGTDCLHTVFEYSETPAALQWLGDSTFALPVGKVGDTMRIQGDNYKLKDVVRGLAGLYDSPSNFKFEITAGTLPEGISLISGDGIFSGTWEATCDAGTVTIKATNKTTGENISFNVNYGAVVEADRYINIGDTQVEMKESNSGTGWSYDGSTKTLTLNNYTGGPISAERGFNIHLKNSNNIVMKDVDEAYAIKAYNSPSRYDVSITSDKGASLSITKNDLTHDFKAINVGTLFLGDYVNLYMTITSSSTSQSYGCYGAIQYGGKEINVQAKLTAGGQLCGIYSMTISSSKNAGADCIASIETKTTSETAEAEAIEMLKLYNTNAQVTAKATANSIDKAYAVYILSEICLAEGGTLDATGMVGSQVENYPNLLTRNIVTTTPANNKYIWKYREKGTSRKSVIANPNGETASRTVFVYSGTKADLEWLGDNACCIPLGIQGSTVAAQNHGYSYDLRKFIRGLDDYKGDDTRFEIIEGSLPEGLSLTSSSGQITGTYGEPCLAGTVTVRAKNTSDNSYIDFIVKYAGIVSNSPVTAVNLSESSVTIAKESTITVDATVTPNDAAYPTVQVTSDNTNVVQVVSVSSPVNGTSTVTLKGWNPGTATVTVTSVDSGIKKQLAVTVVKAKPEATIDFEYEVIRNLKAGEVYLISVDGGAATEYTPDLGLKISIDPAWIGKTISIAVKGATAALNSDAQELAIPARGAAPTGAIQTKALNKNSASGKLTLPANCEYRKQGTTTWLAPTNNEATGLSVGTYEYRKCATSTAFASEIATAEVGYEGVAFTNTSTLKISAAVKGQNIASIYVSNYVTGGTEAYTYSLVSGPAWLTIDALTGCLGGMPTETAPATTAVIKVVDDELSEATFTISICAVICATHSYTTTTTRATLTANGKIVKTCTVCGVSSTTVIYRPYTFKLSATAYTYDGKVKTPTVTVKDTKGKTLVNKTDYTVAYSTGRKAIGKYTVTITFKGKYSGTKKLYFTIIPKGTSISKLTALKGGIKVTLKKQATQTTGYQIQYSTSSKFTSAKTVTITKNTTLSKSITKLSKGKRYYVRVRTYKKVGSTYYYSGWSSAKYVTTKK